MQLQSAKFLKYTCCRVPNRLTWLIAVFLFGFTAALPAQKLAERMPAPGNQSRSAAIKDKFSRYRQYTMKDGLSNNSVKAIAQDEDNFMWFGTEEGLNRFDGERFTSFFNRYDNKGIPYDDISTLLALPEHRLLIGTLKGLCVLDTRKLEFAPVNLPNHQADSANEQSVQALHLDRNGQIWVGTNAAVHLLNDKMKVVASFFRPAPFAQSLNDVFALEFLEFPNGTVAVKAKEQTLPGKSAWHVIDFKKQTIEPLINLHPGYGVLDTAYAQNSVASDGQQHLWFTATHGLSTPKIFHFNFKTKATRLLLEEKNAK
ncbi:MAG: two-component regulator propeller domain-containing protein, partial [Saprospiraceae bacterium]